MKRILSLILAVMIVLTMSVNASTNAYQNTLIEGVSWPSGLYFWDCYHFAFQHVYENLSSTQLANWGTPCEYYNKVSADYAALGNNRYPHIDPATASLNTMANGMVMELQFLGYYATYTTFVPNLNSLHSDEYVVCFRRRIDDSTVYHFMRYEQSAGAWWQKFPSSWPTQYNAVMSNSVAWNHEGAISNYVEEITADVYDGSIIYILYSETDYYNNWENRSVR